MTALTLAVTLAGVTDPPYPPVPGQPGLRQLREQQLRQAGYSPAQIEALLRPLPPLPQQYTPEPTDWAFVIFCIGAVVFVVLAIACAIGVAANV